MPLRYCLRQFRWREHITQLFACDTPVALENAFNCSELLPQGKRCRVLAEPPNQCRGLARPGGPRISSRWSRVSGKFHPDGRESVGREAPSSVMTLRRTPSMMLAVSLSSASSCSSRSSVTSSPATRGAERLDGEGARSSASIIVSRESQPSARCDGLSWARSTTSTHHHSVRENSVPTGSEAKRPTGAR